MVAVEELLNGSAVGERGTWSVGPDLTQRERERERDENQACMRMFLSVGLNYILQQLKSLYVP